MQQFHPIIYSVIDGAAVGRTVLAKTGDEAGRNAAGSILNLSLAEVDRLLEKSQLEVIAVIKGDPQFERTKRIPLFPGL